MSPSGCSLTACEDQKQAALPAPHLLLDAEAGHQLYQESVHRNNLLRRALDVITNLQSDEGVLLDELDHRSSSKSPRLAAGEGFWQLSCLCMWLRGIGATSSHAKSRQGWSLAWGSGMTWECRRELQSRGSAAD